MKDECCGTRAMHSHAAGPFFGRVLLSLIFILAGIGKIFDFDGAVAALAQMGVQNGEIFVTIGLIMEIVGGVFILLGWMTALGSLILMVFLLPTTLIFHGFWNFEGKEMVALQLSIFLRNLGLYGGLLLLMCYGPGRWSFDALRCKRKRNG